MKSGAAQHYETMPTDQICAVNVPKERNSVLFLWATVPMLPDAFLVMKAWGYKYKTMLTWRKVMSQGMGYWWRGQTEHVLFGIRGTVPAFRMQEKNIIEAKVRRHSQKPDEFRELFNRAGDKGNLHNRLSMFARGEAIPGWDQFGLEADNSIILQP